MRLHRCHRPLDYISQSIFSRFRSYTCLADRHRSRKISLDASTLRVETSNHTAMKKALHSLATLLCLLTLCFSTATCVHASSQNNPPAATARSTPPSATLFPPAAAHNNSLPPSSRIDRSSSPFTPSPFTSLVLAMTKSRALRSLPVTHRRASASTPRLASPFVSDSSLDLFASSQRSFTLSRPTRSLQEKESTMRPTLSSDPAFTRAVRCARPPTPRQRPCLTCPAWT